MRTEFNKEQFDAIYPEGIENHYWNHARNKLLKYILKKSGASKNILEIGCGKGIVTAYLLKNGFGVSGVELAEVPISDHLKSHVRSGMDVFDLSREESKYIETVLLLDVIEHLENPDEFIKKIKDKFPNLKRFIVTVPARQEIFSNYDTFNGHHRRYSREKLVLEFNKINYSKASCSYFFHSLYFPARLLVNFKKEREVVINAPKGVVQIAFHQLLALFFYIEYFLYPSSLFGSSLIIKIEI